MIVTGMLPVVMIQAVAFATEVPGVAALMAAYRPDTCGAAWEVPDFATVTGVNAECEETIPVPPSSPPGASRIGPEKTD